MGAIILTYAAPLTRTLTIRTDGIRMGSSPVRFRSSMTHYPCHEDSADRSG